MKKRHYFFSLSMFLLLIVAVAGWFATDYLGNIARREIIGENQGSVLTLSIYTSSTLNNLEGAVKSLAGSPWIAPALMSKRHKDIENANSALDRYNSASKASVSYLMAADGMTVASTNRNDPDSFVGKSYRFRPYFQEAAKGQAGRYFALDTTSGKRGFYASYPVQNHLGKVIGVVTMKIDLDEMAIFFSRFPLCFLINPDGIIFLSSSPAMVLKNLWSLDKAVRDTLIASQQFGNTLFETGLLKKEIADGTEVNLEGKDYFVSRRVIDTDRWSIVLLTPTDHIKLYQLMGILAMVFICLLIIIFSGVIYIIDRSKDALRQSEERSRLLLHSAGEGIFGVDVTGQLTFINPAALRILGFAEDEMVGQSIHTLIHHSHEDGSNYPVEGCPMYASCTQAIENSIIDEVLWRKDGSSFPAEYSSTPMTTDGKVIGAVVTFSDVTERKQAEEEICVLSEIGRVIGSTLDIGDVYERFAAESRQLIPFDSLIVNLKKPQEDTLYIAYASGKDIPERRRGDSFPLKGSVTEAAMRTRIGLIVPSADILKKTDRFSTLDASLRVGLFSMMSVPLISRAEAIGALVFRAEKQDAYTDRDLCLAERIGSQIAGAIANAQLFTALKGTEMSLRESEGRFRALIEQAAVGVAEIVMETGQFITVNRRLCEMVGRTEEELLATTFQAITHPEDLHLHEEKTALLVAGKIGHYSLEKRYLRKDGEIVWVNITVSPLWKPGEKPGRNMVVVEDISEREKMEAEMREMSLRDLLTDLYNRRGFITLAEQQLKASNRAQKPLKLTFIDCDGLKWINDILGHKEGDKALIDTAHVLRQTFRDSDIIARLGGDEFAVLSIDVADMSHEVFSQRLQLHIDELNSKASRPYKLSISWGTAMYHPASPMSLDQLIATADELMYTQKKGKSNRKILVA